MAQFEQWFAQDFRKPIFIRHCESVMFTGDDKGAIVGVRLYNNETPYSGGGTVSGAVKRSDGGLVPLTGTLSGNAASVVISAAALAYPGPIGVHIVLTQGGSTTTVLKVIYSVDDNSGAAVDPGTIIPSVNDLITAINTAVASIPSDYSDLLHTLAPDFSASTAYAAGDYVWYNGTLYRFTVDHAAGSWTGTDATAAVVGNDLSNLKSAIDDANIEIADLQDGFAWSMDGLRLSETVGRAMQVNGQVLENSNWRYYSVHLDDTDAIYYAMGYSWYGSVMPYIFIADNTGEISYTEFEQSTTPTFHDNIRFRIKTTGTLYLNRYGTSRSVFAYKSVLLAAKSTDVATNAVADYHTRMIGRLFSVSNEAISYSEKLEGYVLDGSTGKPRLIDQSATQFVVEKYAVDPFDTYHVIASHYYGNGIFSVFDADGNCLYLVYDEDGGASYTTYDADYTMPYNAAYCYIAYNTQNAAGSIVMRVPSLPPAPTPFIGKKWIALGDSLTAASTLGQNVKNYVNYVSESLGLTAYNKGDGGTGYWYKHIYNSAFYQRAANFTEDADIITIFGSFNDLGTEDGVSGAAIIGTYTDSTTSTICGCINETIDVLIEKYPNAIIGIIAPTPWANSHESTGAAQETYVSRLKQICEYRSIPFLDLFHASSLRPWDSAFRTAFYHNADGTHPNTEGHKRFTPMIVDFIKRILY